VDQSFSKLLDFYVLPPPDDSLKWKILREGQPWLSVGRKLRKLEDFCAVASEVVSQSKNCEGCTTIDDILIAADNGTLTLGKKEISLGPVGSAIFNMLAQNAGQAVSRDRLRRSVSDPIDPSNLDAHIYTLRFKLGVENRKRIRTVPGVGYMYVSPNKEAADGSEGASQWHRDYLH
jgi:DNA-binding response OmpR family regulator